MTNLEALLRQKFSATNHEVLPSEAVFQKLGAFWQHWNPLPGAIKGYHRLCEKYEVYILSTAPWKNPLAWSDKLVWVQRYLGEIAYKRLIISHHKNLNSGDYLIDDRIKNGAGDFKGEHIHFGTESFPDWNKVCKYLNV